MNFFGKELPTDKINFVMNCVSFVLGIIFFIRMQYKMNEPPLPVNINSEREALLKIENKVDTELKEIKRVQDSLAHRITITESKVISEQKEVKQKRTALYATLQTDWDTLPKGDQSAYVNKIMSNLKQKK